MSLTVQEVKERTFDVVVVGAGPAGAAAAFYLKKKFDSVILLDKRVFPREKLCGGAISKKTRELLLRDWGIKEDLEEISTKAQTGELYIKNQLITNISLKPDLMYFVSRADFDHLLVQKAVNSGVVFEDSKKVIQIDHINGSLVTSDNQRMKADLIVAADGFPSFVSKQIGLRTTANSNLRFNALAYEVDVVKDSFTKGGSDVSKLYLGFANTGYGWVFPKKTTDTLGLGGLYERNLNLKDDFIEMLNDLKIDKSNFKGIKGHWIPSNQKLGKLSKDRIFLVGDAAGLADPLVGEGIYYALRSGKLLADSITKLDLSSIEISARTYKTKCEKSFENEFRYAYKLREFLSKERNLNFCIKILKSSKTMNKDLLRLVNGDITFKKFWWKLILRSPILFYHFITP